MDGIMTYALVEVEWALNEISTVVRSCCVVTVCFLLIMVTLFILYKLIDHLIRYPHIRNKKDKYVLITGCSAGFGRELVKHILNLDCYVIASHHSPDSRRLTPEDFGVQSNHHHAKKLIIIGIDVSDHNSIIQSYQEIKKLLPLNKGIWALVNNAGIPGPVGPTSWLSREDFKSVLDVNLLGQVDMVNTYLPLIKKANGRIVNMSSILGRLGVPNSGGYCVSKGAVEIYSDVLRREVQMFNVSVHVIEPGAHRTNLIDSTRRAQSLNTQWQNLSCDLQAEYGNKFFENLLKIGDVGLKLTSSFSSIRNVLDTYEHSIFALFPRTRYILGVDAHIYLWLSFFPDWIVDFIFWCIQPNPASV